MKMLSLGANFMVPYWAPEIEVTRLDEHWKRDWHAQDCSAATFAYAMNMGGGQPEWVRDIRDQCKRAGVPTVWATIEDPNNFDIFAYQAAGFDVIATSDAKMIPEYQARYPAAKVIWLPLACQPAMHYPSPLRTQLQADWLNKSPADTVLIANWYDGAERIEQLRIVVDPVVDAGLSMALYAYPDFRFPPRYEADWRGGIYHHDVRHYYAAGRVALGISNQMHDTTMCSMRIFEVLACGLPMVAAYSDAFEALGFENSEHFLWTPDPAKAVAAVRWLLDHPDRAQAMAERGRQFVLSRHTYWHRLQTILEAIS